jgi:hypothetical protein
MKVTLMAYSHNSSVTGMKSTIHAPTKNGFFTFRVNQIGKRNMRYLSSEKWLVTVNINTPETIKGKVASARSICHVLATR